MRYRPALFTILFLTAIGAQDSRSTRLTKPWSQLTGLSTDQKTKLSDIHKSARAEIQKILEKERRDCMTILTQSQLDQLRDIEDQKMVDRKLAATQPAEPMP